MVRGYGSSRMIRREESKSMNRKLDKKIICLASAALLLTAGASAEKALAYFTTYTLASGGARLDLGFTEVEKPEEDFSDWTKTITVHNREDGKPCFIRIKLFAGAKYQEGLEYLDDTGRWTPGEEGYYYYRDVVEPGGTTGALKVRINGVEEDDREEFNVIVVQEHSMVFYDEAGNPVYNWTAAADNGEVQE